MPALGKGYGCPTTTSFTAWIQEAAPAPSAYSWPTSMSNQRASAACTKLVPLPPTPVISTLYIPLVALLVFSAAPPLRAILVISSSDPWHWGSYLRVLMRRAQLEPLDVAAAIRAEHVLSRRGDEGVSANWHDGRRIAGVDSNWGCSYKYRTQ